MSIRGGPDIIEDGLVLHLDAADENGYESGNAYILNLAKSRYVENDTTARTLDDMNFYVAQYGGSVGSWSFANKTFSNSTVGTNFSYPRMLSSHTLTNNAIYEVYGRFSGDTNRILNVRLTTGGAYNGITYNNSTGEFSSVQIQNDLYTQMDVVGIGTYTFSVTLEEFFLSKINAGLLRNSPTISNGFITFDGTNDYIDLGDILDDVIAGTDNKFTLSLWAKFNSLPSGTSSSHLISKCGEGSFSENERQMILMVRNYNSGGYKIEFITYGSLNSTVFRGYRTSDFSVEVNNWYNIVLVYDGSLDTNNGADRVNIYVNGNLKGKEATVTSGSLAPSIPSGAARIGIGGMIGKKNSNSPIRLFNGSMGNISIYNKTLTSDEITQNYNATKGRYGL